VLIDERIENCGLAVVHANRLAVLSSQPARVLEAGIAGL
jgi:hypothetical protein